MNFTSPTTDSKQSEPGPSASLKRHKLGMCGIDFFISVWFLKKLIRFRMSLVRFASKNAVWFGYYRYFLLLVQWQILQRQWMT